MALFLFNACTLATTASSDLSLYLKNHPKMFCTVLTQAFSIGGGDFSTPSKWARIWTVFFEIAAFENSGKMTIIIIKWSKQGFPRSSREKHYFLSLVFFLLKVFRIRRRKIVDLDASWMLWKNFLCKILMPILKKKRGFDHFKLKKIPGEVPPTPPPPPPKCLIGRKSEWLWESHCS